MDSIPAKPPPTRRQGIIPLLIPPPSRRHATLALATLLTCACSSSSVFSDYPDNAIFGIDAFELGAFADAANEFQVLANEYPADAFLGHAEAGMAWHTQGELRKSTEAWLKAAAIVESFEDRPTVSGRSVIEGASSFLINDKTLPYDGEDFEVALLHGLLAWDYLRLGLLDDSLVEVRKGYAAQERAEVRYKTTYGMNRFTRFLSAVAQEIDGRLDDARIDLASLDEELPDHPTVKYSTARIQKLLKADVDERKKCEVILVFERGRMPEKTAAEITYDTDNTVGRISIPQFGSPSRPAQGIKLLLNGKEIGKTVRLEKVFQVAKENLGDRIAWLTVKSIGRAAAKTIVIEKIAEKAEAEEGDFAGLLVKVVGSLWQIATERADLRSWVTLPLSIDVLRISVPVGEHHLNLELLNPPNQRGGSGKADLGIVQCSPARPVMIHVRSLGARLFTSIHTPASSSTVQP